MEAAIDEATSRFLLSAAADLQRQMSVAGVVEKLWTATSPLGTSLVATIRIADRCIEVAGQGDSVVTAYADLRRRVAEPTLVAAHRSLIDHRA